MLNKALRVGTIMLFTLTFSLTAYADFSKTIPYQPGKQINAVTTWYFANCTTSLGLGSYSINVAPAHGVVSFADVSGPLPGCPQGSPSLPAAAAYYTWTDTTTTETTDKFQLYFLLNGQVAEVIDITVAGQPLTISPTSLPNTTSGDPYSVQFSASGAQGPVSWSVTSGSLPAGFTLSSQGLLSSTGSPAAVPAPSKVMTGPYSFTVQAQDGVNTATQALTLTVLTADCSQKLNVNITKIIVTPNANLSWNVFSGWLYLGTNTEILGFEGIPLPDNNFYRFYPVGIQIDAGTAVSFKPGASVYETPKIAYINNMTGWSGSATYGRGSNSLVERNAVFGQTDMAGNPLPEPVAPPLLDGLVSPWVPPDSPFRPFRDSPNANVPLVDKRQQPLTSLSYTKGFTNYVACYFDSDQIPRTLATVNWYAHYSGTVIVPELFGVLFPRSARFFQDPGDAVTYNIQQGADLPQPVIDGPLPNCHQTYENFPGVSPAVPPARCKP